MKVFPYGPHTVKDEMFIKAFIWSRVFIWRRMTFSIWSPCSQGGDFQWCPSFSSCVNGVSLLSTNNLSARSLCVQVVDFPYGHHMVKDRTEFLKQSVHVGRCLYMVKENTHNMVNVGTLHTISKRSGCICWHAVCTIVESDHPFKVEGCWWHRFLCGSALISNLILLSLIFSEHLLFNTRSILRPWSSQTASYCHRLSSC